MEKMKFETPDMTQMNIEKIAALFPNCITEKKDANGKITKAVNFDALKQILGDSIADGDESYEFTWVGKRDAMVEAAKPIRKTLRPCVKESVNFDTTENLYIEGDNLEALKLLQEGYLGKVKMIYIDPPYNTGHDSFVYPDNYAMSRDDYSEKSGAISEEGKKLFVENNNSNPRFHSDWCSMIYMRLLLARNLLKDNGLIFISIDDNEVDDLKKICSEVFGEDNFLGCAGRITKKANNQGDFWAPNFDYLLTFAKNKSLCPVFLGGANHDSYNLIETEGPRKGERYQLVRLYMSNLDPMRGCVNQRYYIECPDGTFIIPPGDNFPAEIKDGAWIAPQSGKDKIWRWSYQSYLEKKNQIVLKQGKSSNVVSANGGETKWNAFTKTYLNDVLEKSSATPNSFIEDHINQNATHELKKLDIPFTFAKPSSLIKYLAEICRVESNDIVLDFFSGSASTADAVMQMNSENDTNIHYVMVQLDEACKVDSDAFKAGFKNICEIGKERIRRAGAKILAEKQAEQQKSSEKNDLFDAQNVSDNNAKTLDVGFRVLKIDDSNMKDVYYSAGEVSQQNLLDQISNIKEDRNDMDLLFGCLVDWGVSLSLPIKTETIEGVTIHNVNDGDLIASFSENIPETAIRQIAAKKPLRVVFRDSSFRDAPSKINVTEIFKTLSPNTTVKVI